MTDTTLRAPTLGHGFGPPTAVADPAPHESPLSPLPERTLRIAMIGSRGIPARYSGIESVVEVVGAGLADRGHDVTVYCWREGRSSPVTHRHVRLRYLRAPAVPGLGAFAHSLMSTLHALTQGYDVIHYHALGPGLFSVIPKFLTRARIVTTVHGRDDQRAKWGKAAQALLRLGAWVSARTPHTTLVVSEELRRGYRDEFERNVVVVPNSIEIDDGPTDALDELGIEAGNYILTASRVVPEKRIEDVIVAHREASTRQPLVIMGGASGTESYVESLRQLVGPQQQVVFTGPIYGRDFDIIVRHARLFVSASELEGLPTTLIKAGLSEVPVLVSDIEAHREILRGTSNDRFVPVRDTASLASALDSALGASASQLRFESGALARDLADRFAADRAVALHELVYLRGTP